MAEIAYTRSDMRVPLPADRTVSIYTWTGLVNGDTGQPVEAPEAADRSVEFGGTFDTSTIVLEGKIGEAYSTLTDPQGNAISKTAASLEQVEEVARYMRPRVTAGGASTSLNVYLLVRR